jgi:hypothetical protein
VSNYRKSTLSHANGNCVEIGEDYRKSSRSIGNGACVEAGNVPGAVLVRDTTDRTGPVLSFPAEAWAAFTAKTAGSGS